MSKLHWGTNNIDCIEGMKHLKDECVDLIVTSPPYNVDLVEAVRPDDF